MELDLQQKITQAKQVHVQSFSPSDHNFSSNI